MRHLSIWHYFGNNALVAKTPGEFIAHFHLGLVLHDNAHALLGVLYVCDSAGRMMIPRHCIVGEVTRAATMHFAVDRVALLGNQYKRVTVVNNRALFNSPEVVKVIKHLLVVLAWEHRHERLLADVGVVVPLGFVLVHMF